MVHRTIIRLIVGIHWIKIQTLFQFTEKVYNVLGVGPEMAVLSPKEQFKITTLNRVNPDFETMAVYQRGIGVDTWQAVSRRDVKKRWEWDVKKR